MHIQQIGRRLFLDATGTVIGETSEREGHVRETTVEEDAQALGVSTWSQVVDLTFGDAGSQYPRPTPPAPPIGGGV